MRAQSYNCATRRDATLASKLNGQPEIRSTVIQFVDNNTRYAAQGYTVISYVTGITLRKAAMVSCDGKLHGCEDNSSGECVFDSGSKRSVKFSKELVCIDAV